METNTEKKDCKVVQMGFRYDPTASASPEVSNEAARADQDDRVFNMPALYYQALEIAFQKFIVEERQGFLSTEARLVAAIEGARKIFKDPPFRHDSPQGRDWNAQFKTV